MPDARRSGTVLRILLAGLAAALCAIMLLPAAASATTTATIEGKVTAESGGKALEGFIVCAELPAQQFENRSCGETNTKGEYKIAGLAAGKHKVEFTNENCHEECKEENFVEQFYNDQATFAAANEVEVLAGETKVGINAALATGGKIEGTVEEASGAKAPINGAQVCVSPPDEPYEGRSCVDANSNGEYTIVGLAGEYKVAFENEACPEKEACKQVNFLPQFYNDVPTFESATPVKVLAGETKAGIDAALVTAGKLEGKVTAQSGGGALARLTVCAQKSEPATVSCATTNAKGEYAIVGLAGEYKVEFENYSCTELEECVQLDYVPQFYKDEPTFKTAEPVTVLAGETKTEIDAALATAGKIEGQVTAAPGGTPVEGIIVCAFQTSEPFLEGCVATNAKGEYAIVGLGSGQYEIIFFGNERCGEHGCEALPYVVEYYNEKFSSPAANLVSVTAPETQSGINARLVGSERQYLEELAAAKQREVEAAAAAAKKREVEVAVAAAAKKHEEEAAAAKHAEEAAAAKHAEEAGASVKIEKVKVTAKDLVLTVKTSERGTVTITGPGLKKTVETLTAGTHVVKVALTKTGRSDRAHRKKIRLAVSLKVSARTVSLAKEVKL